MPDQVFDGSLGVVVPRNSMDNGLSGDAAGLPSSMATTTNGASGVNGSWNPSSIRSGLNSTITSSTSSYQTTSTMANGSSNGLDTNALFAELEGKGPIDQLELLEDMLSKATNLKRGAEGVLKQDLPVWPFIYSHVAYTHENFRRVSLNRGFKAKWLKQISKSTLFWARWTPCMSLDLFKAKDNPIRFQCLLRLVALEMLHFKVGNRHRSRPSGGKSMAL